MAARRRPRLLAGPVRSAVAPALAPPLAGGVGVEETAELVDRTRSGAEGKRKADAAAVRKAKFAAFGQTANEEKMSKVQALRSTGKHFLWKVLEMVGVTKDWWKRCVTRCVCRRCVDQWTCVAALP